MQKAIAPQEDSWRQNADYIKSLLRCQDALIQFGRAVQDASINGSYHAETATQEQREAIDKAQQEITNAFIAHTKYDDGIFSIGEDKLGPYREVIEKVSDRYVTP